MITSVNNPKVKRAGRLQTDGRYRRRESAFVIEGTRWVKDAAARAYPLETVFYTAVWLENEKNQRLLQQIEAPAYLVDKGAMAAMSGVDAPPGVTAVAPMRPLPLPDNPTLCLILDQVTTPGNLGTLLRTAVAASVDAVLLSPGCVDPYNPKAVRGGMGAHFRLPIHALNWAAMAKQTAGMQVWLAELDREAAAYTAVDWTQPSALIIGNEANGAGEAARQLANGRLFIPMNPAIESLNAAVAGGIILFEAVRQRADTR